MTQIQHSENSENLSSGELVAAGEYSLEGMKSLFYLMNAKPDTTIQLLEGRKKITIAEIRDLNDRIQRKLQNHDIIGQIASINLIFEKGKIQDYSTWAEFEREKWNTLNNKTEAISITWDISLKLPRYQNPQRHTLKVRIGQSVSPKDMMELIFNSDNMTELREKRAIGVVKVDFIDQVIASELIANVTNWHEGLQKLSGEKGIQKIFEKYQNLFVGIVHNFTPVALLAIYHYYFIAFCSWGNSTSFSLANIQLILIIFLGLFFLGSMIGKRLAKWTNKKIDDYKGISQFEITKGDENAVNEAKVNNSDVTRKLITKIAFMLLTPVAAFFIRHLLEKWFNN